MFMGRIKREKNRAKKVIGITSRPRLAVKKTLRHIIAQVIDDTKGVTLAYVVSAPKEKNNIETAKKVGVSIAEKALKAGITQVAFDRRRYYYHGKVKALAEAARGAGLKF
jgi:large subunit ribosomal protein L18